MRRRQSDHLQQSLASFYAKDIRMTSVVEGDNLFVDDNDLPAKFTDH